MTLVHLLVNTSVARLSLPKYTVALSTWSKRMVGRLPRTWSANFGHLTTSTTETRESMMSETPGELPTETAFALPLMRMVVFWHFEMRIECEILASTLTVSDSFS